MSQTDEQPILDVRDLAVHFHLDEGIVRAVNGVSFRLRPGRSIAIVGESGCGKTVSAFAILRILAATARIVSGQMRFRREDGSWVDLARLAPNSRAMRAIRGGDVAMVFQEPMTAFSPVHTISNQIAEAIRLHQEATAEAARDRVVELLRQVGIPDAEARATAYPFQLSGGMRQRAMIAMALACHPRILIADEPTTALDVTIQAQVLRLIKRMQAELGLALILITHDLAVVSHMVDHVHVMYLGRVVEEGPVASLFDEPLHPYTRALLRSIPRLSGERQKLVSIEGSVPDPFTIPGGCPFHPRCPDRIEGRCDRRVPAFVEVAAGRRVSCFLHSDDEATPHGGDRA